jgi:hypothetical protein
MLHLLLDENISRKAAPAAKKRCPAMAIVSLHDWEGGRFLATDDGEILKAAAEHRLTLVTYDQNTVLTRMAALVSEGCDHGGIIVVDEHTIRQHDIGGLVKALGWLWNAESHADWTNRTVYLRAAREL